MTLKYKIWENGCMFFEDSRSELFLRPKQIKYCVNWLNLHNEDLKNNKHIPYVRNEDVGIIICSLNGFTSIATDRYFVLYSKNQLSQIKKYINDHRKRIGCQEVLE